MSSQINPDIVTDSLVLALDTENSKSYPGEPATNLATLTTYSNRSDGEQITVSSWGGDDGYAKFNSYPNPIDSPLIYRLVNTTSGTGGVYNTVHGNFTLTEGVTYTRSWYMKANVTSSISGHICSCNRASDNLYLVGSSITVTPEWQRYSHTFTVGAGQGGGDYRIRHISYTDGHTIDICGVQVEANSHPTQFTSGTRSSTDGWKDLSGNSNHGQLDNISYNSNAGMEFSGTPDAIPCGIINYSSFTGLTVSCWFNGYTGSSYKDTLLSCWGDDVTSDYCWLLFDSWWEDGKLDFLCSSNGTTYTGVRTGSTISSNTWTYVTATWDSTSMKIYLNGSLSNTNTTSIPANLMNNNYNTIIGHDDDSSSRYFQGQISQVRIYDGVLTATEVLQNYNAHKTRFGH